MNRREFAGLVAGAAVAVTARTTRAADSSVKETPKEQFGLMHDGPLPVIGMLAYPGMTLLDLAGPQSVFATSCRVHLLWKTRDLIVTDMGVTLQPDTTLADCPKDLDVLFVGGGGGQAAIMNDPEIIRFMADRGSRARYVTSVCSGSLVLGAAGLLNGYRAACHWACLDALRLFGATPVAERVVVDRNRYTGGGVTAGIDFGLVLLNKLLGEEIARMTQLAMEYDPQPPFDAGSPMKAGEKVVQRVRDWLEPVDKPFRSACEAAARAMPR